MDADNLSVAGLASSLLRTDRRSSKIARGFERISQMSVKSRQNTAVRVSSNAPFMTPGAAREEDDAL